MQQGPCVIFISWKVFILKNLQVRACPSIMKESHTEVRQIIGKKQLYHWKSGPPSNHRRKVHISHRRLITMERPHGPHLPDKARNQRGSTLKLGSFVKRNAVGSSPSTSSPSDKINQGREQYQTHNGPQSVLTVECWVLFETLPIASCLPLSDIWLLRLAPQGCFRVLVFAKLSHMILQKTHK